MDERYFHDIHAYLSGEMGGDERAAFEAAMAQSPGLRRDVDFEKKLLDGIEANAQRLRLRSTVGDAHERLRREGFFNETAGRETPIIHLKKFNPMKRAFAIAAAVAVAVAAVWFIGQKPGKPDTKAIFAKFNKPGTDRATAIAKSLESHGLAGAMGPQDTLREGISRYANGDYAGSIALLDPFLQRYPQNDTAMYYLASDHMSCERYARAVELYTPITQGGGQGGGSVFQNDALWQLSLIFIVTDRKSEACQNFEALSNNASFPRHREARAAYDQLLCGR